MYLNADVCMLHVVCVRAAHVSKKEISTLRGSYRSYLCHQILTLHTQENTLTLFLSRFIQIRTTLSHTNTTHTHIYTDIYTQCSVTHSLFHSLTVQCTLYIRHIIHIMNFQVGMISFYYIIHNVCIQCSMFRIQYSVTTN